jgi:hypothetical protein
MQLIGAKLIAEIAVGDESDDGAALPLDRLAEGGTPIRGADEKLVWHVPHARARMYARVDGGRRLRNHSVCPRFPFAGRSFVTASRAAAPSKPARRSAFTTHACWKTSTLRASVRGGSRRSAS